MTLIVAGAILGAAAGLLQWGVNILVDKWIKKRKEKEQNNKKGN